MCLIKICKLLKGIISYQDSYELGCILNQTYEIQLLANTMYLHHYRINDIILKSTLKCTFFNDKEPNPGLTYHKLAWSQNTFLYF